ncbi:CaiB/BaiF CoA-transferase family protein [Rhodococcus erythropolis]
MSALSGVRVLDLSVGIAGPIVGMFLGDFGADVVRVEGAVPDPQLSSSGYAVWNRNKRSVRVDPMDRAHVDWLTQSVAAADVVILGADAELSDWGHQVAEQGARNGELVTVRLPAYLDSDPAWIGGESNHILAGMAGQAMRQSSVKGGPVASMSPYISYIHGIWATVCTVAALIERTVSGAGQVVTVTGLQAILEATVGSLTVSPAAPDPDTAIGATGRHPTYRHFVCGDGLWMSVGALGPKFEERILRVLELDHVLEDPRIGGVTAKMALPENLPWVQALVEAAFASKSRSDMLTLIENVGIPCGPMNSREEWFDSEQVAAIDMRVQIEDPARGSVEMPGIPINLTRTPGAVRLHAPQPGEHDGIAPWPVKEPSESRQPRFVPGPLTGFQVLNMGTFVASPYAGMLLSELGADVIKVEPYTGDPFRMSAYTFNRGMRSVAIDLSGDEGRSVFLRLAAEADLVMDAMRPGVMKKLGIDYEALVAVNPRIVTQSLSAYGERGPNAMRPGVDMVLQAESGMMSAWGGDDIPVANTVAITDVATASISALLALLGLYERQISGVGQRSWNSLAATSVFLQMESMVRFDGAPAPAKGHHDYRGAHPLQSYYRTTDGWIAVDVPEHDREAAICRLRSVGIISTENLGDDIRASIAVRHTTGALADLKAVEIPCAEVRTVSAVVRDPELLEHEAFHIRKSDDGSTFVQTGKYAGFSRTQRRGPMVPPGVGEHTREVLRSAGIDESQICALVEAQVVHAGQPLEHVLPISYR